MNDYSEKTARILDEIIAVALKNNAANPRNLPPLNNDITASDPSVKYHAYQYCLNVLEKYNRQKEIEAIKFKKLKWDAKISEFQAKTKWWPLIISIISLLISVYLLFFRGNN